MKTQGPMKAIGFVLAFAVLLSGCQSRPDTRININELHEGAEYLSGGGKSLGDPLEEYLPIKRPEMDDLPEIEVEAAPVYQDAAKVLIADERKLIAFTFDDGPSKHTDRLLDVLKKYDAKATFFIIGVHIEGYDNTLKRMNAEGHQLASHSYSHKDFTKATDEEVLAELKDTDDLIYNITGVTTTAMRVPYGAYNRDVMNIAKSYGQSIVLWNVDTEDWKIKDPPKIREHILDNAGDGSIVLLHDFYGESVDAVELVIEELVNMGYIFVTVDQLLTRNGDHIECGSVYREMLPVK